MAQENVEIVGRLGDVFERGGLDELREYYHPDIEWHEDPSFPEAGVYRGLEAVESYNRVIGAPNLGEAPREDVEGQRDWWAD